MVLLGLMERRRFVLILLEAVAVLVATVLDTIEGVELVVPVLELGVPLGCKDLTVEGACAGDLILLVHFLLLE